MKSLNICLSCLSRQLYFRMVQFKNHVDTIFKAERRSEGYSEELPKFVCISHSGTTTRLSSSRLLFLSPLVRSILINFHSSSSSDCLIILPDFSTECIEKLNKVTEMVWDEEDTWCRDDLDIFKTFLINFGVPKAVNEQETTVLEEIVDKVVNESDNKVDIIDERSNNKRKYNGRVSGIKKQRTTSDHDLDLLLKDSGDDEKEKRAKEDVNEDNPSLDADKSDEVDSGDDEEEERPKEDVDEEYYADISDEDDGYCYIEENDAPTIKKTEYKCTKCDKCWPITAKSVLSNIKQHIINNHFAEGFESDLSEYFQYRTRCESCRKNYAHKKRHLYSVHRILMNEVDTMFEAIKSHSTRIEDDTGSGDDDEEEVKVKGDDYTTAKDETTAGRDEENVEETKDTAFDGHISDDEVLKVEQIDPLKIEDEISK